MKELNQFKKKLHKEYTVKRPVSKALFQQAAAFLPGGDTRTATFFRPFPHFIERGQGCYIWDVDGNKMVDFQNNYTSLLHGHAFMPVIKAVNEQMGMGTAYSAPNKAQIQLAKILCERIPSIDLLRFTTTGTEATMHAVRCARAYTSKTKILKLEGGYHGTSDIFETSVDPELKKAGPIDAPRPIPDSLGVPKEVLNQVLVVPFNNIPVLKNVLEKWHKEIAAFIIEPIMGSAGMIEPLPGYLKAIRELTTHYNIVLIFDEIVTFRLTTGGAQQYYGVTPDLTTLGKPIGGGLPVGAFGGKAEIMKLYDPRDRIMYHSGAYNGNAVSMRAGIAALQFYGEREIFRINDLGRIFARRCTEIFSEMGLNAHISGVGSLWNIVFSGKEITEYRGVAQSHEELNLLLNISLINKGVFNAPRGMFCMSTAMTENEVNFAANALKKSLTEMLPVIKEQAPELLND